MEKTSENKSVWSEVDFTRGEWDYSLCLIKVCKNKTTEKYEKNSATQQFLTGSQFSCFFAYASTGK